MTVILTFATALVAGWVIDRLAFNGELVALVRDEVVATMSRRKQPVKPARTARRRAATR